MSRKFKILMTCVLIVALLIVAYLSNRLLVEPSDRIEAQPPVTARTSFFNAEVDSLLEERRALDEGVWAQEVAAQKYEETIVKYWDRMLRPQDDKYAVLAEIPFDSIALDAAGDTTELDWGIERTNFEGRWRTLDQVAWREFLRDKEQQGYIIDAIEFHQSAFDVDDKGDAVSTFGVLLNIAKDNRHLELKTQLRVEWTGETDADGNYLPGTLTASDTKVLEREGPAVFEHRVILSDLNRSSHPIVYDLNRDGSSEIIFPSNNIVLWNRGDGEFERRDLFTSQNDPPDGSVSSMSAVVADFDGDGLADLLYSGTYSEKKGVFLFRGNEAGEFSTPGEQATAGRLSMSLPMCLTAGDVDGDGDLDVWLAQYKTPYSRGAMPTPFHDANDGYPSYLLLNRGDGHFDDGTEAAGLAPKRYRRTYAASLVDLDGDRDVDLLVSSDFAGTDIYYNDGAGRFTDETAAVLDEAANFGMGHTLADFDNDGALDFYVIGMGSTTMRRLNQMGLIRPDRPEYLDLRTRMGYGNRMYLAGGRGAFRQPEFKDSLARSGWAWGTTSFDFDSDGDRDIYVANGHKSGETTKDYCTQFWCHDIYTDASKSRRVISDLFDATIFSPETRTYSWDGYQKNHLFMNQSGEDFVNVAYLMSAALGDDARSVISDDFDGDGRPDLLVTSIHQNFVANSFSDRLHLYMNRWPISNNWIGVRLQEELGAPSPLGARIEVESAGSTYVEYIVSGDSFRSQHAPMKHFGLGKGEKVDSIFVQWTDGTKRRVDRPAINQYHLVRPNAGHPEE
jgi:hypothetical protein